VPLTEAELAERAAARPDKVAIGVEGGFQLDAKDYRVEVEEVGRGAGSGGGAAIRNAFCERLPGA
jgi:hypothetical protein